MTNLYKNITITILAMEIVKDKKEINKSVLPTEKAFKQVEKLNVKKFFYLILLANTIFIIAGLFCGKPVEEVFGKEASFITWVSFGQLLISSIFAWKTFLIRGKKGKALLWLAISIGFLFLSIDEVARIHENMDSIIHKKLLHMKETPLSDRLDDLIIGIYALIGCSVLYAFRIELKRFKQALPYLITSLLMIFLMVITELISNRYDLLPELIHNENLAKGVYHICKVGEEAFKLYAEALLATAFYCCLAISKKIKPLS